MGVVNATQRPLYPTKRAKVLTAKRTGRAEGPSTQVYKVLYPPGFDPQTVQAVARRYTDCALPVDKA